MTEMKLDLIPHFGSRVCVESLQRSRGIGCHNDLETHSGQIIATSWGPTPASRRRARADLRVRPTF